MINWLTASGFFLQFLNEKLIAKTPEGLLNPMPFLRTAHVVLDKETFFVILKLTPVYDDLVYSLHLGDVITIN